MPRYLLQLAYTPEAWASQLKNPQNRVEIVAPVLQRLGGRFESTYLAFGQYDIVAIMDLPDNVSAAAAAMVFAAGGAVKSISTTPLITAEEAVEAMRKAGDAASSYRPPST
jgi:uncharacterized protein with GYD domain